MQLLLDCVTTILTNVLCVLLLWNVYSVRNIRRWVQIIGIACIISVKMGLLVFRIPFLNFISSYLMFIGMLLLVYTCRIRVTVLYATLILMIMLAADALGVLIVSAFYDNTISTTLNVGDFTWQHHFWNWLLQIIFMRSTALLIRRDANIQVRWHEIIFYILLLVLETVVFSNASNAVQNYMSGQFLIQIMAGFLLLDIYVMYIFHRISQVRKTEQELRLVKQQERFQTKMYQELRKKYDAFCSIAHDMNRHIRALQELVGQHPNAQAEAYLFDLTKETQRFQPQIRNQNAMLEIILNTTLNRCEKEKIRLDLEVEDFPLTILSDLEITVVFSNLLDNAMDACLELPEEQREISVQLRKQVGLIMLQIANPCRKSMITIPRYRHSTKKNHTGIGLHNVRHVVEEKGGVASINQIRNQFVVNITFIVGT